jgi:hypothetical protein
MRELELATRIWVPDAVWIFRRGKPGPEWNLLGGIALIAQGSSPPALENKDQKQGSIAMPNENDLEGMPDQRGKHGGQKGMPTAEPKPPRGPDQGIVLDESSRETGTRDRERARQVHKTDTVRR